MWGEWIEIYLLQDLTDDQKGLSPCGESGLKSFRLKFVKYIIRLSPCGESGLKSRSELYNNNYNRLSPCGESGLKSVGTVRSTDDYWSLPVWGEWIEIYQVLCRNLFVDGSLPVWGEWIEI